MIGGGQVLIAEIKEKRLTDRTHSCASEREGRERERESRKVRQRVKERKIHGQNSGFRIKSATSPATLIPKGARAFFDTRFICPARWMGPPN